MKKSIILILFAVLATMTVSVLSVSAQNIDVNSMDNEQLTALLLQILGKLQQDEAPVAENDPEISETPASIAEPVPAADPEAIEEIIQITIYDNKKLIIEALPSYMFIQPTKEPGPEKPSQSDVYYYEERFKPFVDSYLPPEEWIEPPAVWIEPPDVWYDPPDEWYEYVP